MLFDNLAESAISIIETITDKASLLGSNTYESECISVGEEKPSIEVGKIKEQRPPNGHPTKQEETILQTEAESYNLQKKKETTSQ